MENNWNRKDWQGRRKNQIDSTNLIIYTTMVAIALTLFVWIVKSAATFLTHKF